MDPVSMDDKTRRCGDGRADRSGAARRGEVGELYRRYLDPIFRLRVRMSDSELPRT
jgi:hypothetical protein